MKFAVGTYTGNNTDNHAITGIGFQADMILIKGNSTQVSCWTTSAMQPDLTSYLETALAGFTGAIKTIDSDGFTLGTDAHVNANTVTFYYMAWKDDGNGDFKVGSYVGDGTTRNISTTFQPAIVLVKHNGTDQARWRPASLGGTADKRFDPVADTNGEISALNASSFTVNNLNSVNASGETYYYAAWKAVTGYVATGVYTGTGSSHDETGFGFQPDEVWVKSATTVRGCHRSSSNTGTTSLRFNNAANDASNVISAIVSDGITIGTDAMVNTSSGTYHWAAWKAGTTPLNATGTHIFGDQGLIS